MSARRTIGVLLVVMALGASARAEEPAAGQPADKAMGCCRLVVEDGHVLLPTAPGLGVQLTEEMRAQYAYVPGSASLFG